MHVFTLFADWLTYSVLELNPASKLGDAVHFFAEDTMKIFVLLSSMIFIIGIIRSGLNTERARDVLSGKSRFAGYLLAAILGAVTPFCSCSSIPLFLGFTAARIPVGITMAFLITSPSVNEAAVAMFASSLGGTLTATYVILGLLSGICGGFLFDSLKADRWISSLVPPRTCACCGAKHSTSFRARLKSAWTETRDILRRISPWVLCGIALGAGLHGYLPEGFVAQRLGGGQWWSVPLAVLVGIPTYANVTSVVPVISELMNQGLPVGTAFAFMLSTAAASVPEFIMLKKVMSTRMLILFAAYLLVYFVLCGWILNAFF